jgi:hypothetical protein
MEETRLSGENMRWEAFRHLAGWAQSAAPFTDIQWRSEVERVIAAAHGHFSKGTTITFRSECNLFKQPRVYQNWAKLEPLIMRAFRERRATDSKFRSLSHACVEIARMIKKRGAV